MIDKVVNVAVTGAAGQIGYALVFRIASGAMFGPNVKVRLQLIELEPQLDALKGVAMEIADCAFPQLTEVICSSDLAVGFANADWAILVGAVPRKKGMERADLLQINGGIFTEQGLALEKNAAKDVKVLVVGNPCNTNALIASRCASRINPANFYAMTMLDQHRAVAQLAQQSNCSVNDIDNCYIWGNHSATQFPDYFNATILGQAATTAISNTSWFEQYFVPTVQQRGAQIIAARGASSAASAANAIVDTVAACSGMWGNKPFSLAVASNGEYGIEAGLVFSYPCCFVNGAVKIVEDIQHDTVALAKIAVTAAELVQERNAVS